MSRSYRNTPIRWNSYKDSEKEFKTRANSRNRVAFRDYLRKVEQAFNTINNIEEIKEIAKMLELSLKDTNKRTSYRSWPKDWKFYFGRFKDGNLEKYKKLMRK